LAVYNDLVVTKEGIELLQDVLIDPTVNSRRRLSACKMGMVTSEEVIGDPFLETEITNVKQAIAYSLFKDPVNKNQIILEGTLTNESVTAPYMLNTIAFYAGNSLSEDGKNPFKKVLFAVITAKDDPGPELIPPGKSYLVNLKFKAVIALNKGAQVDVLASYSAEITGLQVQSIVAEHDELYSSHKNLFGFYNLMNIPKTKYTVTGLGTGKITEKIATADSASRLIAENITEKSGRAWKVTEKLFNEDGKTMQTRTITYNKTSDGWEATVV